MKVAGAWRYVYWVFDQAGQVIDVFVSAPRCGGSPAVLPARHRHDQDSASRGRHRPGSDLPDRAGGAAAGGVASNVSVRQHGVEADHGRLKARLAPMRGLKQERSAAVIVAGPAFIQNVRRGRYELAAEEPANRRVARGVR